LLEGLYKPSLKQEVPVKV